ncbi:hypothetical protein MIMGU_mgv1a017456mg [Erythranthe guttata]|uniref:Uncharacterized protein n=1 Tax=Erythranthe guttata TaxID=4155 RepID=A0A022Q9K2_ERYGU|nr:hypothetical protein MIMGU_mgv1a017456mg [Erythranthe guttata]
MTRKLQARMKESTNTYPPKASCQNTISMFTNSLNIHPLNLYKPGYWIGRPDAKPKTDTIHVNSYTIQKYNLKT